MQLHASSIHICSPMTSIVLPHRRCEMQMPATRRVPGEKDCQLQQSGMTTCMKKGKDIIIDRKQSKAKQIGLNGKSAKGLIIASCSCCALEMEVVVAVAVLMAA